MGEKITRERIQGFHDQMRAMQIKWRHLNLSNQEYGNQNGGYHEHVLPTEAWELNLWSGINSHSERSLPNYIKESRIRKHTGSHNLLSSWILCANLYFPFRCESGHTLLAGFLRQTISPEIQSVDCVELEYESQDVDLKPSNLLGEMDGGRGAGQTSPDVAFLAETQNGPGIILVECKFTEHNFYPCSGRKPSARNGKPNPDVERCLNAVKIIDDPHGRCHLYVWERKYWDQLRPVINRQAFSELKACPAAFDGYQLFRQQSLAEGIAQSGKFAMVVSSVAYDARNSGLMFSLKRSTGMSDIRSKWGNLFAGKAGFTTFTHQEWVDWVREHDYQGLWKEWLGYIAKRYGL